MGKKLVEIVGILDRSGSMSNLIDETITGYNAFIKEQKKLGPAKVTLAIFDDRYDLLYQGLDIKEVPKLTNADFYARGMTALRDAVGKTINAVNGGHKKNSRPDKTLVFIMTDGYENNSSEYSQDEIKKLVKKCTKKRNWEFFFMGADIDAFEQGSHIGVNTVNTVKTTGDAKGVRRSFSAVGATASLYAGGGNLTSSLTMEDMYSDADDDE